MAAHFRFRVAAAVLAAGALLVVPPAGMAAAGRVPVWTKRLSGIRKHTVKVVVVGTAKRPNVRVDGLAARR